MAQELTVSLSFHNTDCLLTLQVNPDSLSLKYEEANTGKVWRSNFTSKYIEDITQKTGNFKKFSVFTKILTSVLTNGTSSAFIDVLTAQDLEELKAKRLGTSASNVTSNKRYLILTCTTDFDKVHYPLPLSFEEIPDVETMKKTIARLSSEIESYRRTESNLSEIAKTSFYSEASRSNGFNNTTRTVEDIRNENTRLRRKLALLERCESGEAINKKFETHKNTSKFLEESQMETKVMEEKLVELEDQLRRTKSELHTAKGQLNRYEQLQSLPNIEVLRSEIERLKNELKEERGNVNETLAQQKEEIGANTKELETVKENDRRLKARIKELEGKLKAIGKQSRYDKRVSAYKNSPIPQSNKRSTSLPQRKPTNTRHNLSNKPLNRSNSNNRSISNVKRNSSMSKKGTNKTLPLKERDINSRTSVFDRLYKGSKKSNEVENINKEIGRNKELSIDDRLSQLKNIIKKIK